MHTPFELVFPEVEKFERGAYCSASERNEIDTPLHEHNKGQFIYAEKGTLHIETADSRYFLPVEHFLWIPSCTRHRIWTNNSQILMFTIYFDQENEVDPFFLQTGVYGVNKLLKEMILFARQWDGYIGENQLPAFRFVQALQSILPQVSALKAPPLLGMIQPKNDRLLTVMEFMRSHLSEKMELNVMARTFGFSTRSLSRLFASEGINFINYLQALRVFRAMELLEERNLTINQVALMVGYESASAFSNLFIKFTGLRPSEYLRHQPASR